MTSQAHRVAGHMGRNSLEIFRYVGGMALLFRDTLYWLFVGPFKGVRLGRAEIFKQMVRVGVGSMPITFMVIFFVGVILALQMAAILKSFGVLEYVGSIISVAVIREMGPLLTSIVMSGYVGAAIAAEIGTMNVSEEILALETSALDPVRFLVVPRVVATMVMIPCLTVMADVVGIFGGYLIGTEVLQISPYLYIRKTFEPLILRDMFTGLFKAEVFAIVIAVIACYEGLRVQGGAEGVGKATTSAVVYCIVSIIVTDCFFTALFFFLFET